MSDNLLPKDNTPIEDNIPAEDIAIDIPGVEQRTLEHVMEDNFLRYSMSVIVDRALPDVRDGLKPVHRRILFSMGQNGNRSGSKFVKSARIVGSCSDPSKLSRKSIVSLSMSASISSAGLAMRASV